MEGWWARQNSNL